MKLDVKERLDSTNGKPYEEIASLFVKAGYAAKYDENGNSAYGYSYRIWRNNGRKEIVDPFDDDKDAYEQRMFLLEYFKITLAISNEDLKWFAESKKVKADAGWYDTREEAENECLIMCFEVLVLSGLADIKSKCIHPLCGCLDYCEAADPYSKTPIENITEA